MTTYAVSNATHNVGRTRAFLFGSSRDRKKKKRKSDPCRLVVNCSRRVGIKYRRGRDVPSFSLDEVGYRRTQSKGRNKAEQFSAVKNCRSAEPDGGGRADQGCLARGGDRLPRSSIFVKRHFGANASARGSPGVRFARVNTVADL